VAHLWTRSARATPELASMRPRSPCAEGNAKCCCPFAEASLAPLHYSLHAQAREGAGEARRPTRRSSERFPTLSSHGARAPPAMRHIDPATSATRACRMLGSAWICNDSVFSPEPCAIVMWLGHGLNTILGPHVRSNAGSPISVGRPAKYKTLLLLVGAGNTWGVVTSVPACSTVPATGG